MTNSEICRRYRAAHPLFGTWNNMLARCGIHKGAPAKTLAWYAGRGITVCDEWRHLRLFEAWCLANGWRKGLQLDRVDNNGNYSPDNCRFVTAKENNHNRRDNNHLPNGWALVDWYDEFKTSVSPTYNVFRNRIRRGWGAHDALYTPTSKIRKNS